MGAIRERIDVLQAILAVIGGIVVGIGYAIGERYLAPEGVVPDQAIPSFIKWAAIALIAIIVILAVQELLERYALKCKLRTTIKNNEQRKAGVQPENEPRTPFQRTLAFDFAPVAVIAWALVIMLFWLPWIILVQPTVMGPDTIAQILWARGYQVWDPSSRQIIEGVSMSDHHPVFVTLIYGAYDKLGLSLGDETIGYRIHGIVQALFMAGSLSTLVCYMRGRLNVPRALAVASIVFYVVVPVFGCMSQVMVKDLLSMPFFVWWLICYIEVVRTSFEPRRSSWKLILVMTVMGVIAALMRKTVLYIELATLVIGLVVLPNRKRLIAPIVVPALVMMALLPMIVFPMLNVAKGGSQEAIAVPLHQTAGAYIDHGSEMSEADLETIGKVLDLDKAAQSFTYANSDTVKDTAFKKDATRADVVSYLVVWMKQAFQYPGSYAKASAYLSVYVSPWLVASEDYVLKFGWPEFGGNDIMPQYPMSYDMPVPRTEGQMIASDLVFVTIPGIPVVGLFVKCCLYYFWLPLLALLSCIAFKRPRAFIMLLPIVLSCCVLLLCPAGQPRYGYNMLYCAPLILFIPFFVREGIKRTRGGAHAKGPSLL